MNLRVDHKLLDLQVGRDEEKQGLFVLLASQRKVAGDGVMPPQIVMLEAPLSQQQIPAVFFPNRMLSELAKAVLSYVPEDDVDLVLEEAEALRQEREDEEEAAGS